MSPHPLRNGVVATTFVSLSAAAAAHTGGTPGHVEPQSATVLPELLLLAVPVLVLVSAGILALLVRQGRIRPEQGLLGGVAVAVVAAGGVTAMGVLVAPAPGALPAGFVEQVDTCNDERPEYRFSCYRAAFETYYNDTPEAANDIPVGSISFEGENVSFGLYGPNCHTFHHAMGDFIAEKMVIGTYPQGTMAEQVAQLPPRCRGGAAMGWSNRMALWEAFSLDWMQRFYDACRQGQKVCAHQIGHLMADRYVASHLELVDDISRGEYGLTPLGAENYVSYGYPINITEAFEQCEAIVRPNEVGTCKTGVGHNQFIYSEYLPGDRDDILQYCQGVLSETGRNDCRQFMLFRIGINDAGDRFISGNTAEGNEVCRDAINGSWSREVREACYIGIGSGIGLYIEDVYAPQVYETDLSEQDADRIRSRIRDLAHRCDEADMAAACHDGYIGSDFLAVYQELNMSDPRIDTMIARICPQSEAPEGFELDCEPA